ncbi:MAG TPA: hypothetical protein VF378_02865 [Geothrix sp.]
MTLIKRGSRSWQLLTLAMVALPWILRDQLATALEVNSREVQQVMIEENAQQQREQQGEELRELNRQLARIELRQQQSSGELDEHQVAEESAQMLSSTFVAEGTALSHRVKSFQTLLPKIAMADATRKGLADKAQAAGAVAQTLETFDVKVHHEHVDALVDQWEQAETHLREAYEQLLVEAEWDRDSSARWATWARFAAWAFTALAAMMMGDWKKLVSVRDAAARTASEAGEPSEEE